MALVQYDPRWSVPNGIEFLRQYMIQRGIDADDWHPMGEIAVKSQQVEDPALEFAMLRYLNDKVTPSPKAQDLLQQASGGVKPLHISVSSEADMAMEAEYEEIEEQASREFSQCLEEDAEGGVYEVSTLDGHRRVSD